MTYIVTIMIIIQKLKLPEENHTSYHSKGNGKSHSLQMSEKLLADTCIRQCTNYI